VLQQAKKGASAPEAFNRWMGWLPPGCQANGLHLTSASPASFAESQPFAVGQNLNDAAADDRDAIEACRLISLSGVAAPRWRHPDRRGNRCVAWH